MGRQPDLKTLLGHKVQTDALKRQHGQYFTQRSPFSHPAFLAWAERAGLPETHLVEPFAGAGGLIDMLIEDGICRQVSGYDIEPARDDIDARDVFADYPAVDGVVVTNPPYMARNSAVRRGLPFPDTTYSDVYLHALDLMLKHHRYVAAIIPAAFGTSDLFRSRLTHLIALPFQDMFGDTNHPVSLALFEPAARDTFLWNWDHHIGPEAAIRQRLADIPDPVRIRFNDPAGIIGLRATDMTTGPTISFCRGEDIDPGDVKPSSRALTRMDVEGVTEANRDSVINHANRILATIRVMTADMAMTPFKGVRKDGAFRRRLDFTQARLILTMAVRRANKPRG